MSSDAIVVEGLSKKYRLGETSARSAGAGLAAWFGRRTGGDKPENEAQILWALRDVSFTVRKGEAIGIIGHNGAGKSTLLRILSRITPPSEGRARIEGRVATMLEVGTGFHPDFTGRENVFMNGAILGMSQPEIRRKLDQIIEFAGVEKFLDTPVKRYSSGMYVRLAFAVAAHLDPDVLIVDEVLAVGDASFQKRSLQRLDQVTRDEGRTVLFVSHNLSSIQAFCDRSILLRKGEIVMDGKSSEVIQNYMSASRRQSHDIGSVNLSNRLGRCMGRAVMLITSVIPVTTTGEENWEFMKGERIRLRIGVKAVEPIDGFIFLASIRSTLQNEALTTFQQTFDERLSAGESTEITVDLPAPRIRGGQYALDLYLQCKQDMQPWDVIGDNVDLPRLLIRDQQDNSFLRQGLVDVDATLAVNAPRPAAPAFTAGSSA